MSQDVLTVPEEGGFAPSAAWSQLRALADQTAATLRGLEARPEARAAEAVAALLRRERLRIAVVGGAKVGKSSLLNALVGAELLPTSAVPCTSVSYAIGYGEAKTARLVFGEDLQPDTVAALPAPVQAHLQTHGAQAAPPLEVPVDQLRDHMPPPDARADAAAGGGQEAQPAYHVELRWPLPLCERGVELIDTPALSAGGAHPETVAGADALLFVMSCRQLGNRWDLALIDGMLRDAGHEAPIFVGNHWDNVQARDRAEVQRIAEDTLRPRTDQATPVFFVSAVDALDGRLNGDDALLERSGLLPLERQLIALLEGDRLKLRMRRAGRQLRSLVTEASQALIPDALAKLEADRAALSARSEAARQALRARQDANAERLEDLRRGLAELEAGVAARLQTELERLARAVQAWVREGAAELRRELTLLTFNRAAVTHEIVAEVYELVERQLKQRWQPDELVSYLKAELTERFGETQTDIDAPLALLQPPPAFSADVADPGFMQPLLQHAGGLQGALKSGQVTDKVRIQSAKHLRQAFEAQAPELAKAQAKRVIEQSMELVTKVGDGLQAQLQAATQSFEDVLATQAAGEAEVQAQRAVLDRAEAQLTEVRAALTAQLEAAPLG